MMAFDTMLRSASIWAVRASHERARSMDLGEMRQTSRSCALDSRVASRKSARRASVSLSRLISWACRKATNCVQAER